MVAARYQDVHMEVIDPFSFHVIYNIQRKKKGNVVVIEANSQHGYVLTVQTYVLSRHVN